MLPKLKATPSRSGRCLIFCMWNRKWMHSQWLRGETATTAAVGRHGKHYHWTVKSCSLGSVDYSQDGPLEVLTKLLLLLPFVFVFFWPWLLHWRIFTCILFFLWPFNFVPRHLICFCFSVVFLLLSLLFYCFFLFSRFYAGLSRRCLCHSIMAINANVKRKARESIPSTHVKPKCHRHFDVMTRFVAVTMNHLTR